MKISISLMFASILIILAGSHVCAAPNDSLVLYLTFDDTRGGTAKDQSLYGNDGTLEGDPQQVKGKFGNALELNGSTDYVRIPKSDSLNFDEGSFTFEAWVNLSVDKKTGTSGGRLANDRGTGAGGTLNGWQLKIINEGPGGKWGFNDSGLDDATGNYMAYNPGFLVTTADYSNGEWYHVAMVYKAGTGMTFYVDGEVDGEAEVKNYGSIENDLPVCIGAAIASAGVEGVNSQFFPGIVDEVRLWKTALSQDQIKNNMTKALNFFTAVLSAEKLSTAWGAIKTRNE